MKDLMVKVSEIFTRQDIQFVLIGALARDIFLEQKNLDLGVRTKDIDFAILVDTWDEFEKAKCLLKDELGMTQEIGKVYRLLYDLIPIDIIPFGKIAGSETVINWPGKFRSRMKVLGLKEAYDNAATITLSDVDIKVVIPEMLVPLKLSSWMRVTAERIVPRML